MITQSQKYSFGVYDFALAKKEATMFRTVEMLQW